MNPQRLIVVGGPTATGKSDLALELAERWDGEVVNGDSMQLYRGMDIGTAKLSPAERRGVPHHLLDVLDVRQTANVAAYQRDARAAIEDVLARGRTPILTGGSGLYLGAVIDEIDFPGTDPVIRAELEAELAAHGPLALHARLQAVDPKAAGAIEPLNGRKIVRALEVNAVTGGPFTAVLPPPGRPRHDALLILLDRPVPELDDRVNLRVELMMAAGWLDEVRALDRLGLREGVTASRALGYRQLLDVVDGRCTPEAAVEQTRTATRRFVRRQRSWFGRDLRWHRVEPGPLAADEVVRLAASA